MKATKNKKLRKKGNEKTTKQKKQSKKELLLDEMENRLICAEKDLKDLKKFSKRIKEINKNLTELVTYYHTDWLEDYKKYAEKKENNYPRVLSEDSIWDVSREHYDEKIKLIKTLINAVHKGI